MSVENNEATKFADKMGEAGKKLADAFATLLKAYMKHQEKMQRAALEEQAKLDKEFKSYLKSEGYEPSKENIEILKAHQENIKGAEQKLADLDKQIELELEAVKTDLKTDGQQIDPEQMLKDQQKLYQEKSDLIQQRNDLQQQPGDNKAAIDDIQSKIVGKGREISNLTDKMKQGGAGKLADLGREKAAAVDDLADIKQGKGLEKLKPDELKNSIRNFKANTTGDKLFKSNGLTDDGWKAAKMAPPGGPKEGPAIKGPDINVPKVVLGGHR